MSHEELTNPVSVIVAANIALGLAVWFIKKYILDNDSHQKQIAKSLHAIREDSKALEKLNAEFSKQVEVRLERLDERNQAWSEKLNLLMVQAQSLSVNLSKTETRLEVVGERVERLDSAIEKNSLTLSKMNESLISVTAPFEHFKSEVENTAKIFQALAQKLRDLENEIKTIQIAIGPNSTLFTSKKKS